MEKDRVEIHNIDYPKLVAPNGKKCEHGVILKVITSNICGSDQHMVRGRTSAPKGLVLGHEITGEVIEVGSDVEYIHIGDLVSVPFNIACGRCLNCKRRHTDVCLNTNPDHPGAAYGYVGMGGWIGGQAEYVMVPYADFNLLKFPDKDQAMEKIRDLTCLSDILPTGYHGALTAGVQPGSIVYVAGAGPVGLACAASCQLLGAAVVIVGDINPTRLKQAKTFGCETINLSQNRNLPEAIFAFTGSPQVDSAIDCVGFEAHGYGDHTKLEAPAIVINSLIKVTKAVGKIALVGLYVTEDPGSKDEKAKKGELDILVGLTWSKSHAFQTGQAPVMKYNYELMQAILNNKMPIAKAVNVAVISLDRAPQAYKDFDKGAAKKFVIDPHHSVLK